MINVAITMPFLSDTYHAFSGHPRGLVKEAQLSRLCGVERTQR